MWEDDDENHGMVCPKTMGWLNCLYVTDRSEYLAQGYRCLQM